LDSNPVKELKERASWDVMTIVESIAINNLRIIYFNK